MPDLTGRVRKHRGNDLEPDETIVKSLVGQPPGSKARRLNTVRLGVGTILPTGLSDIGADQILVWNAAIENPLADRVPRRNVYITLTSQRMLVHTTTALGKPKELACSYAHDEIAGVRVDNPKIGDGEVFVQYADDSITNLLMVTNQKPDEFVDAWHVIQSR
ncbi:MAG: hypothetical protein HKN44_14295 [Ilumatobacter sp.]|nr:hypothetical protein [Ilumatobacter sp.]